MPFPHFLSSIVYVLSWVLDNELEIFERTIKLVKLKCFKQILTQLSSLFRIVSDSSKERPRPRKPDYLRESFDLAQLTKAANVPPKPFSTMNDSETLPRLSPPRPCDQMRSNIHPHQRTPREESIAFPSSSGEESVLATEESRHTVRDAHGQNF